MGTCCSSQKVPKSGGTQLQTIDSNRMYGYEYLRRELYWINMLTGETGTMTMTVNFSFRNKSVWIQLPSSSLLFTGGFTVVNLKDLNAPGRTVSNEVTEISGEFKSQDLTSMTNPRFCHGLALFSNKVYAFSGFQSQDKLTSSCEVFEIATKVWRPVADIITATAQINPIVFGNLIYMLGGYNSLQKIQIFNPSTESWATSPLKLPYPHTGVACFQIDSGQGIIYFAQNCKLYAYAPEQNSLRELTDLRDDVKCFDGPCAYRNGKLYVSSTVGLPNRYDININ
mmetsp:Transcript_9476/g.18295  ORF Transcript_9476/g.18295 Transcript_9476/m.18295 type:complete len:283 (+) Transcript_9476:1095-1943(+)